jgi:hypothetical protein
MPLQQRLPLDCSCCTYNPPTAKTDPTPPWGIGANVAPASLSLSPERSGALPRTEERELVIMTLGPSAGADGNAVAFRRVPRWIVPPRYP